MAFLKVYPVHHTLDAQPRDLSKGYVIAAADVKSLRHTDVSDGGTDLKTVLHMKCGGSIYLREPFDRVAFHLCARDVSHTKEQWTAELDEVAAESQRRLTKFVRQNSALGPDRPTEHSCLQDDDFRIDLPPKL